MIDNYLAGTFTTYVKRKSPDVERPCFLFLVGPGIFSLPKQGALINVLKFQYPRSV